MALPKISGRAPHGARGLKHRLRRVGRPRRGRAPHGARGLKQEGPAAAQRGPASRPARGAWIETRDQRKTAGTITVAPRTGRVD